jgi:hypothetical protein
MVPKKADQWNGKIERTSTHVYLLINEDDKSVDYNYMLVG